MTADPMTEMRALIAEARTLTESLTLAAAMRAYDLNKLAQKEKTK